MKRSWLIGDQNRAVGSTTAKWQGIQRYSNYSRFYQMCDSIEGVRPVKINATTAGNSTNRGVDPSTRDGDVRWSNVTAEGVGLEKALRNFALWYKYEELPGCESDCFQTCVKVLTFANRLPGLWVQ